MLPLDACVGRSDVGGKAETLARMRAAGLAVAEGVVVLPGETLDGAALAAALARLGGGRDDARFAVRSSSTVEDAAGGSAAGLFHSLVGVRAGDVARAVDEVRASAGGPAVRAYLQARGLEQARVAVAVLIQPVVAAAAYGVAHSSGDAFAVEERAPGVPEWGDVEARVIGRDDGGPLAPGLRALEAIVGGDVDAEFARTGDEVTWLQARPLVAPPPTARAPAMPGWRLDAEHNPDPLSTAQASLVAFADGLGVGAPLRVVDRYLYVGAGVRGATPIALGQLRRRFADDIVPDCMRALAVAGADGSLDAALDAFAHVYRRYYGEVSPSLRQARRALDDFLRAAVGEPLASHGVLVAGTGGATVDRDQRLWELGRGQATLDEYVRRFGDHAPSWDVATPTDRERPDRVHALAASLAASPASPRARQEQAIARAHVAAETLRRRLDAAARDELDRLLPAVRAVLPIAEDDDLLYLQAQATVRRALLALRPDDDVFEATLDEARAGDFSRVAARRAERLAAAQQAAARPSPPPARDILRGAASSGHARGRAVIVRALADAPASLPPDAVLVVAAIVPSLTPLLATARALVTDHGGALSHGATLAREYGVPAVLGVGRATALTDGVELYVDGDAGRVYVLG